MQDQMISHYRIVRKLGAGGMGEVYLAEDTKLDRQVALKLLPSELSQDAHRRQRFFTEAKAASALNHPHVCVIHEVGETDDHRPYLIMEFIQGQTLTQRLKGENLEISEILDIGIQTADALDAAHAKGIVHRDIKPSNICLNERNQIKVLDFGLAKRIVSKEVDSSQDSTQMQTQVGQVLGTPNYMSPEQALGKEVDHRSDLFSLGVVLYELTTGRTPFAGESFGDTVSKIVKNQPEAMARFNYDVPGELERIVRKCLSKDVGLRYQSSRELLIDLTNLRSEMSGSPGGLPAAETRLEAMGSGRPAAEALTLADPPMEDIQKSDIFISYANVDDKPVMPGRPGWISQFHRNLEVRVEQLSGEPIKICHHPNPVGEAQVDDELLERLPAVKTLVSVVSPPFIKSTGCRKEVEAFWTKAEETGNLEVEHKSRIFKVVKSPVDPHEIPPPLPRLFSRLIDFEFFDRDVETGRLREYDETFGAQAQQRYHEKIYDLAHEICQVLKHFKNLDQPMPSPLAGESGKKIFLAMTTSDLQPQRDRLRRELIEQGHTVLPAQPLPFVASELEGTVRRLLEECDLAIHLVGDRYGLVPEDSELSVVALQNQLAADHSLSSGLDRLIWMPRGLQPRDERQAAFVKRITEDPESHHGAEVIADTLENLKEVLEEKLRPREAAKISDQEAPEAGEQPPRIYLICDREDEAATEPLEDFFYNHGIEVSLPGFDVDESEFQKVHLQNLQDCDAVLIFYGAAGKSWVDIKLRELLKAVGYRDAKPITVQGVYVAPPVDRRKERFRTLSAEVIRQTGETFDSGTLEEFATKVKSVKKGRSE